MEKSKNHDKNKLVGSAVMYNSFEKKVNLFF
jgi:hypothetical protein